MPILESNTLTVSIPDSNYQVCRVLDVLCYNDNPPKGRRMLPAESGTHPSAITKLQPICGPGVCLSKFENPGIVNMGIAHSSVMIGSFVWGNSDPNTFFPNSLPKCSNDIITNVFIKASRTQRTCCKTFTYRYCKHFDTELSPSASPSFFFCSSRHESCCRLVDSTHYSFGE